MAPLDPDPISPQPTPGSGDQLLTDLLNDAKIVAAYAERAGLLKSTALPEAISSVEKLDTLSWGEPVVVKLQTELNATMRDLAPTTMHDLKGRAAPFSGSEVTRYSVGFVICWAIIILFVALGTMSHNYGVSIVKSLEELEGGNSGQRIEDLVRSIVSSTRTLDTVADTAVPSTQGADAVNDGAAQRADYAIASTFLANLDEAKALDEKTFVVVNRASQFITENFLARFVVSPSSTLWEMLNFGAKNDTPLDVPICTEKRQASIAQLYQRPEFGATAMARAIRYSDVEGLSLTCMSEFHYHLRDYPQLESYIGNISLILNVYGLWLLPALYGALGASMYHLRRALNPILPTPPVLRTVNRTIMGSFAGIIIAWFWAPAAQANVDTVSVGFNLFVVAFLIGYSIDVFFTFLDRVLVTATGSIGRLGTAEK